MSAKIFNDVVWSPEVAKNADQIVRRVFSESANPEDAKKWLSVLGIRDIEAFTKNTGINISGSLLMNFLVRSNSTFIDELRTEYGLPFGPSAISTRTMGRIIEEHDKPKASANFIPPAIIRVARVMNFSWSDWLNTIPKTKHNNFWQRIALKTHSQRMAPSSRSAITQWLWEDMQNKTAQAHLPSHVLARLVVAGTTHGIDREMMASVILEHVGSRQAVSWEKIQSHLILLSQDKVLPVADRAGLSNTVQNDTLGGLWRDAWLRKKANFIDKNNLKVIAQKKI